MKRVNRLRIFLAHAKASSITHNVIALYSTQIATYVFPLAVVPYLARVLGPSQWGKVAFAQAIGAYVSTVVDFGFSLSATRRVARFRDDKEALESIFSGVLAAKLLLALTCIVAVLIVGMIIPAVQKSYLIFWAGAMSGVGQGFSMLWYYQGLERMKISATMDMIGKAISAAGVFIFVHHPQDAWRVVGLQCVCYCGVAVALLVLAYRDVALRWPTYAATNAAIRESASMFLFLGAVSLYTTANTLILGIVATPAAVAFYAGGERLAKALLGLLDPINKSLFPRLSRLLVGDHLRAIDLVRVSLGVMVVGAGTLAVVIYIAAPLIIRIVFGQGYEAVIPVLRVVCLLLPTIAVSNVLGIQWMLPLGMDREFNRIIIVAGLLNIFLAFWWAREWQQMGMAWAVVCSEIVVSTLILLVLFRHRLSPLSPRAELEVLIREKSATLT